MTDPRELAIRRNECHLLLTNIKNRIKYAEKDKRVADNKFKEERHDGRLEELYRLRSHIDMRLVRLRDDKGLVIR